jgi:hypothetical protein
MRGTQGTETTAVPRRALPMQIPVARSAGPCAFAQIHASDACIRAIALLFSRQRGSGYRLGDQAQPRDQVVLTGAEQADGRAGVVRS